MKGNNDELGMMNYKLKNNVPEIRFPEFKEEWANEQLGNHIRKTDKKNKENLNLPVYSINNKEGFLPQSEQFDGVNSKERGFDISIYKIIQPKTFAYNPARINVGSIGYNQNLENILISSLYVCFQTDDKIEDSFLLQFLDTDIFKTSVLRYQEGGVRQYLFFDSISKIPFSFPTLPEQKKIAHFFTTIDQKINQLQEKKTHLEQYKKGIMQKIFAVGEKSITNKSITNKSITNYDLKETRNSSFVIPNYIRFKDDNGQDFPEWEVKKLGEITSYVDYRGKAPEKSEKGIFLVTAKNIKKGFIDYNKSKEYVPEKNYLKVMSKGLPKLGDILFTTEAPLGNICQVDRINIALAQRVIKLRGNNNISNEYLLHYMLSHTYQTLITRMSFGTTVAGISGKALRKTIINLPSIQEQTKIANFLSKIDKKINNVTEQIEITKTYKKGLLQKMYVN